MSLLLQKLLRHLQANRLKMGTGQPFARFTQSEADRVMREFEEREAAGKYHQKAEPNAHRPAPGPESGHYAVLEVEPGASFAQIKAAYRRLMKKYHPDKFPQDAERRNAAEAVARRLNEAYTYFEARQ